MRTKTISPPRCRRNDPGVLLLPPIGHRDKSRNVRRATMRHDTMRRNAPSAKANVLPKDSPTASHRPTAISNRVAASAMLLPNVRRATPTVRNNRDPISREPTDRAPNDQAPINRARNGPVVMKHDAIKHLANQHAASAHATNNRAANGRSPTRHGPNGPPSATDRRRASAPPANGRIASAVPNCKRPKLPPQSPHQASRPAKQPSDLPRRQPVLHSLRSPAWV